VTAKVESGILKEKDEVLLMPSNVLVNIKAIEISKERVNFAMPGSLCEIALVLPIQFDLNYIRPGNVLCDKNYPIH
jgi:translation elongation factor EF-1alpha